MSLQIDKTSSTFIILIIFICVFIYFMTPSEKFENITPLTPISTKQPDQQTNIGGQTYAQPFVDTSNTNINKIDTKRCSTNCCKYTQWPVPFNTGGIDADNAKIDYSNIVSSNFSCSGSGTGSGCLCVNKDDMNYLSNHFTPIQG